MFTDENARWLKPSKKRRAEEEQEEEEEMEEMDGDEFDMEELGEHHRWAAGETGDNGKHSWRNRIRKDRGFRKILCVMLASSSS